MSKPGLFRALKEFLGEFRSFGNSELDHLKAQANGLQRQLDQLEAMRAARVKQEEELALMQAQSSVQTLQQLDKMKKQQEKMVSEAIEAASVTADKQVKAMLEQKAQEVVSRLDLSKAMATHVPPEEVVANAMQQVQTQLKVVQPSLERAVEQGKPSMQASSQQAGILSKDKG